MLLTMDAMPEEPIGTIGPIGTTQPQDMNIAGFWQRCLAFFTDAAVLIAAGTVLGFLAMDTLAALGPWGRVLGTAVTLLYFSISDSSLSGGASPGKRFMGLKVVGATGEPVPPGRAFIRSLVFVIPVMVDARCPTCPAALEIALGAVVYGGGGAMLVLFIINKATRQSIHDLAAGTYVIKAQNLPAPPVHVTPRKGHYLVAAAVALVIAFFITIATVEEAKSGRRAHMARIVAALGEVPGVGSVHALGGDVVVSGKPMGFVQINAKLDERPDKGLEAKATELVRAAMTASPDAFSANNLRNVGIRVSYGYDIGFSVRYETFDTDSSPEAWEKRWSQREHVQ